MLKNKFKKRLIVFGILAVLLVPLACSLALAQTASQTAATPKLVPAQAPSIPVAMPTLVPTTQVPQGVTIYPDDPLLNAPMTPEAVKESYQLRQRARQQELASGGFKWMPWSEAGQQTLDFIKERDPEAKTITGDPRFRDIAVADIDGDKAPEVIVYDWTECVAAGCPVTIYFSNKIQKPVHFIVTEIKPFKHGVTVDGTYFEF